MNKPNRRDSNDPKKPERHKHPTLAHVARSHVERKYGRHQPHAPRQIAATFGGSRPRRDDDAINIQATPVKPEPKPELKPKPEAESKPDPEPAPEPDETSEPDLGVQADLDPYAANMMPTLIMIPEVRAVIDRAIQEYREDRWRRSEAEKGNANVVEAHCETGRIPGERLQPDVLSEGVSPSRRAFGFEAGSLVSGSPGGSPSHHASSMDDHLRSSAQSADKRTTAIGTPVSPKWDEDWIAEVEAAEAREGHRCCGAHAPDGEPCILQSTSENGRCRFHGGAKNIGAPKGNTNARIHGLYMRRVQQCSDKCPMWKSCPLAGKDIMKMPAPKRPLCAYEVDELTALRALDQSGQRVANIGSAARWETSGQQRHPMIAQLTQLRENLNILEVMITRASKALQATGFTREALQHTDNYYQSWDKPSAILQAFITLSREHRMTTNTYLRILAHWGNDTSTELGTSIA